ncbi:penicillin-binding protein 1C [Arboricoccus pini]|uniref:peptidoglycan glycosyltransferase n=1 Tax=Arboricoccus pini TaxID=1963835 RepID=A0A212Q0X9_9PROT|nr:penicillin-binding protein 1C [Arboricoccus pini]SNB53011.1 penicillin-binding protein 1C [Arboricoccus pini]
MRRRLAQTGAGLGLLLLSVVLLLAVLDRVYPPDLRRLQDVSTIVVDRNGHLLRPFRTDDGVWRFTTRVEDVSPHYIDLLLAIEDRHFYSHPGVDPLALLRACLQVAWHRHVVSGGSTLTMQVARLLEPRPRTLTAKLIEIARALQLEWHYDKNAILSFYLTLAPMGGNLEGVRAGAMAWLGHEPASLSAAEAALLVALPQAPSKLRPDRENAPTQAIRDRVLARAEEAGVLSPADASAARATPIPVRRLTMPMLAPHLSERLAAANPSGTTVHTTIDGALQTGLERMLRQGLHDVPAPVNLAAIIADHRSGTILAQAGSAAYMDQRRSGMIDMTRAIRSPGSTLKPLIYAMAFDARLAHPATIARDAATRYFDYAPHNFDGSFNGDVTLREALQFSLNLPAVALLDRLGPVAFATRMKEVGLPLTFQNPNVTPALPIALGGVGTTLTDLVTAYAGLANGGIVRPLVETGTPPPQSEETLVSPDAAAAVADILAGVAPPTGLAPRQARLGFKTGTSYRFRDGWAIGFDGRYVVGVWMGRADGGSCNCVGIKAAAIMQHVFGLLPPVALPVLPQNSPFAGDAPATLVRLDTRGLRMPGTKPPTIAFPIAGSALLLDLNGGDPKMAGVALRAEGGTRPYRWLVDGRSLTSDTFATQTWWAPREPGFSTITVVDATGASASANVRVLPREPGG